MQLHVSKYLFQTEFTGILFDTTDHMIFSYPGHSEGAMGINKVMFQLLGSSTLETKAFHWPLNCKEYVFFLFILTSWSLRDFFIFYGWGLFKQLENGLLVKNVYNAKNKIVNTGTKHDIWLNNFLKADTLKYG